MNNPRCGVCGAKMKRNGRTSAGTPRWRCTECGASAVRRIDSTAKTLEAFLAWLLSDPCQSNLYRVSAFSVTDASSGYGSSDPLAIMEAALRDSQLLVPRMFDSHWVARAEEIVRKFTSDYEDAPILWEQLRETLSINTNIR